MSVLNRYLVFAIFLMPMLILSMDSMDSEDLRLLRDADAMVKSMDRRVMAVRDPHSGGWIQGMHSFAAEIYKSLLPDGSKIVAIRFKTGSYARCPYCYKEGLNGEELGSLDGCYFDELKAQWQRNKESDCCIIL